MKFALNYSPQAEEALAAGLIDIDLFKCSDQNLIKQAQRLKPVYVHLPLDVAKKDFSPDWKNIEAMKNETNTRFVNMHLSATSADFPDIPITSVLTEHRSVIMDKAVQDAAEFAKRFGADNVILENDPYHAEARESFHLLRPSAEPSVISEVMRQTRCGLLLDLDHARVSAHYMRMSLEDYVSQLPIDRLQELHMTGTRPHAQEGWLESHHEMRSEDWKIFDWALGKIKNGSWPKPHIYAFEYGGIGKKFEGRSDKEIIVEQVSIFRDKIAAL